MTKDVIALTRRMPDARAIVAALLAAGPDHRLQPSPTAPSSSSATTPGGPCCRSKPPSCSRSPAK